MTSAPHLPRQPALDGLRGLAALAVVVAHLADAWTDLPWAPAGGQMGVLVFFVLSGYLIARLVVRLDGRGGYIAFLRRRVVRLGPVIGVVAVMVPFGLWLDERSTADAVVQSIGVLTQTTGLSPLIGWHPDPILLPTWSLTTEWIFYLTFPAAIIAASHLDAVRRHRSALCLFAALALYALALPLDDALFYFLPGANLAVLLIGASLAFAHNEGWSGPALVTRGPAPYFCLMLLAIFVFLPGSAGSWSYRLSVMPATTLAAVVLIEAIRHGHPAANLLSRRSLVSTGLRAYSLYLWHLPVMWATWRLIGQHGFAWVLLAGVPLLTVITIVSFRLLEAPVLPAATARRQEGERADSHPAGIAEAQDH